jgi:UDP-glucose 4-epimerase
MSLFAGADRHDTLLNVRLLITGGAGYIGSVCAARLVESGHEVVVVDDLSTGHRDAVPDACEFVRGDIGEVAPTVLATGVDAVMHFAAKSLVAESVERPDIYWQSNTVTSIRLLEAMKSQGVSKLVFSSTAATYGEPETMPITEDVPTCPTNTYGATKLAIDMAISSFATAYEIGAASLRYFNVGGAKGPYGERHTTETHLIPLVLQVALGLRDSAQIFGTDWPTEDGTCIRDYVHVEDLAAAHELALANLEPGTHEIYNLGSGTGFSVRQVIEACREVTGHPIPAVESDRRSGDPAVLVASAEKAKRLLGWEPSKPELAQIVADAWNFALSRND